MLKKIENPSGEKWCVFNVGEECSALRYFECARTGKPCCFYKSQEQFQNAFVFYLIKVF